MFNFTNEIKFKRDPMGQFNSQVNKNGNESTKAIGFLMKKKLCDHTAESFFR